MWLQPVDPLGHIGLSALAATLQGALYGLFPTGWIVVAAVFLYRSPGCRPMS